MTLPDANPAKNRGWLRFLLRCGLVCGVVGCLAGVAVWWFALLPGEGAPVLRTVPIQHRDLRITISATGTVEPTEIVQVGADVPGKLIAFGSVAADTSQELDVGSKVRKGDVLFQIDRSTYDIAVQKAKIAVQMAAADAQRSEARLLQATQALTRAERLRGTMSASEYETIVTTQKLAAAELAISQTRQQQARTELEHAQFKLQQSTVRAPVDGVIIDRRAILGQFVSAGQQGLFLIARDLNNMRVRASVGETDIGKIHTGQPVTFTVDAHRDKPLRGTVSNVMLNARVQGNFVTYDVLVDIEPAEIRLFPHMTADVEIEIVKAEKAWLVPDEAIQFQPAPVFVDPASPPATAGKNRQPVVWIAGENGKVRAVPVRKGLENDGMTQVIATGLQEQMPVAVGVIKKTRLARIVPSARMQR